MRAAAKPEFIKITEAWEGPATINWLFPDVKNLVSTGMGLLLDPVGAALLLPWRRADGELATRDEIVADFYRVKNDPNAARLGHLYSKKIAQLRCNPEDIHAFVLMKVASNESILRQGFPEYDDYPADAQLAMNSLAWALGPSYFSPKAGRCYFPKLTEAIRGRDWRTASVECKMDETGNSGLRPRNAANRVMFTNAAIAQGTLDPETLFYPTDLEQHPVSPDDPTQPALAPVVDFPIVHPAVPLGDDDPDDAA